MARLGARHSRKRSRGGRHDLSARRSDTLDIGGKALAQIVAYIQGAHGLRRGGGELVDGLRAEYQLAR
ncbi:MAG TPA: hypothetical protein VFB33_09595 [Candidatus Binataceae bacterium]|jgi:hypothetical protein|nr:hypothetical protein [Candidatus Binataceae bacterium]